MPLERARRHMKAKEYEDAIRAFDEVIRDVPDNVDALLGRGLAWHHLGEMGNALADYEAVLRIDPGNARAVLYRGNAHCRRGEYEEAIEDYNAGIALEPDEALGYEYRAHAWYQVGEHEKMLADLDEVLRRKPDTVHAHVYRGHALRELDRDDEALEAFDEAIRLDPKNTVALQSRAMVRQARGDLEQVQEDLEQVETIQASMPNQKRNLISGLLQQHFAPASVDNITITERVFPLRVRADLQRAVDRLFRKTTTVDHFCGVGRQYGHEGLNFAGLLVPNPHDPATSVPPQYEEVDIGETEHVRCLKNGIWLLRDNDTAFAVLLAPQQNHGPFGATGLVFQVATVNDPEGTRITREFLDHLEESVLRSECYRGKILSLEVQNRYSGAASGLAVHRLETVEREAVILPKTTVDLLDRNIIDFARRRPRLAEFGLSTKKGILFYGPPGTGKTHTIHYLARALEGHTMFLITAEQIGLLGEYTTLARLLQPSVVVIEDVDLIARDRSDLSTCEEVLLHKLLNEMDGLRPDAEVLFILTTNRPEALETALASRPGRIDQAIEFPLPDQEGRAKLIRLYSRGLAVPDQVVDATVKKTERVSASFIKELMRRAAQFQLERDEKAAGMTLEDIDGALEELLFTGGSLNRKLLGALVDDDQV